MIFEKMKILKSADEIRTRVCEMGKALSKEFQGSEPVAICVLSGSFIFYSDLIRAIDLEMTCEFLGVSSYKDQKVSSGEVALTLDLSAPIDGKDVFLIEDLVDSGLTMNYLTSMIKARKPRSLTTISLLLKPLALKAPCPLDLVGFEIPNDFVVGYGIDFAGQYRNLPYLALLDE
jgi:hypoxanthine phosphoribosyltransferase